VTCRPNGLSPLRLSRDRSRRWAGWLAVLLIAAVGYMHTAPMTEHTGAPMAGAVGANSAMSRGAAGGAAAPRQATGGNPSSVAAPASALLATVATPAGTPHSPSGPALAYQVAALALGGQPMTHPGGLCLALAVSFTLALLLALVAGSLTRHPDSSVPNRAPPSAVMAQLPNWLQPDMTLLAVSRT